MKCNICGGELIFKNGIGICTSCGANHKIDHFFEKVEVYLCYIENDVQGRRTRDSIIAADIYQKLQAKKINTFYEHISVSNVAGDDLAALKYQALYKAKIVLVIGSQEENFINLYEKYTEYFQDKKIIPVYSDMRPEGLPAELRKLQALNYDAIGADSDMVKGILNLLGRGQELELAELQNKRHKNRRIILVILLCIFLVIIGVGAIIFLNRPEEQDEIPQLTSQEIYNNAQALMDEGKYLEAADMFQTISDFKNSSTVIKNIYDRYDGYYQTENLDILFYINIQNGETSSIMLEHTLEGNKKVSFEESAMLIDDAIKMTFTDTQANTGSIEITLVDDGFSIKTTVEADEETLSIGNLDLEFKLEQRTDKPQEKGISNETIMSWMCNKTTLSDLTQAGYEVVFDDVTYSGGGIFKNAQIYTIENTDIKLLMMDFDLSITRNYNEIEQNLLSDYVVYAVIAPAELIAPQEVGEEQNLFSKDEIMYFAGAEGFELLYTPEGGQYSVGFYRIDNASITIQNDTLIGITSKELIGEYNYNQLSLDIMTDVACNEYVVAGNGYGSVVEITEKNKNILLGIFAWNAPSIYYYSANLDTLEIRYIKSVNAGTNGASYDIVMSSWKNYPEEFGLFLE